MVDGYNDTYQKNKGYEPKKYGYRVAATNFSISQYNLA